MDVRKLCGKRRGSWRHLATADGLEKLLEGAGLLNILSIQLARLTNTCW